MKKSRIILVGFIILMLAVSLVVPALAEAGNSWYEYGEGTLSTHTNDDGSVTISGGGDSLYPFHYMVYRDKLSLDGFSTKLSAKLWNQSDNDSFAYIAFGNELKEGVNLQVGVSTNVEITEGVIFKFRAVSASSDYGFPGLGIGVVFQVYKNNQPIAYYNDFGNIFIPASEFENLTFSVKKMDTGYEFKINDQVFDYAEPRLQAIGQSATFEPLDSIFENGEAYFSTGLVVLENKIASLTLHEINGNKITDMTAENIPSSVPSSDSVSSITFDDDESSNGCGNKSE